MADSTVQLIYQDNPGGLPATYTIPPSVEVVLSSVFARINGAAAASAFVPCLDLLSQDGKIISRVAVTQTLAVGDLARVTWAPFLRRQTTSAASSFVYTFIRRDTFPAQVVGTGAWVTVNFTGSTDVNQDATRFGVNGVNDDFTDIKKAGRYGFKVQTHWDVPFAGLTGTRLNISGVWTFFPTWTYEEPGGAAGDTGNASSFYIERDMPGGTTTFSVNVRQQSGANKTLESASLEIAYVGDFTNMGADFDTY